jgi:hypothetical protein
MISFKLHNTSVIWYSMNSHRQVLKLPPLLTKLQRDYDRLNQSAVKIHHYINNKNGSANGNIVQ